MVLYNQQDDDENAQQPGVVQPIQQTVAAPTSQPMAQQTVSGTGQGGQGSQRGSGRFTNIQKYLKANQSSQLGQQLGEEVKKEAQNPLSQIGSASDRIKEQLGAEQRRLGGAQNIFTQIQQDPTKLQESDVKSFRDIYTAQAQAPSIENLQDLQSGVSRVGELSKLAGTESGRFDLLKQFYGKPTYSTGQQRLDQLILQGQPSQASGLAKTAQQASRDTEAQLMALKGLQSQGSTDLATQVAQRQKEAQELLGQEAVGEEAGTGLLGGLVDTVESRTKEKQSQADAAYEALQRAFTSGFGKPEEMEQARQAIQAAGIDPTTMKVYDIADQADVPKDFLQKISVTPQAIASQDERARLSSLYKLAGRDPGFLTGEAASPVDLSSILGQKRLGEIAGEREQALTSQISKEEKRIQDKYGNLDLLKQAADTASKFGNVYDASRGTMLGQHPEDVYNKLTSKANLAEQLMKSKLPPEIQQQLFGFVIPENQTFTGMKPLEGIASRYLAPKQMTTDTPSGPQSYDMAEFARVMADPDFYKRLSDVSSKATKEESILESGLKKTYGTTLSDLLNRFQNKQMQTTPPKVSKGGGKVGLL